MSLSQLTNLELCTITRKPPTPLAYFSLALPTSSLPFPTHLLSPTPSPTILAYSLFPWLSLHLYYLSHLPLLTPSPLSFPLSPCLPPLLPSLLPLPPPLTLPTPSTLDYPIPSPPTYLLFPCFSLPPLPLPTHIPLLFPPLPFPTPSPRAYPLFLPSCHSLPL